MIDAFAASRKLTKGLMVLSVLGLGACQTGTVGIPTSPTFPSGPVPTCDGSGATSSSTAFSFGGSGGCLDQITDSLDAAANTLRFSAPYQQQRVPNFNGSTFINSYSLAAGRFEYAHAVDVKGGGQIISIRDNGFDMTHDEFIGKTILYQGGLDASSIQVEDHGTAVASIAAASASFGDLIGTAPDAALHLSSWNDEANDSAAVRAAEAAGAIVMNNSWGYVCSGDPFNECGVNDYSRFWLPAATTNAFLDYAGDEGVVVFSMSNEETQTQATYMAALPVHFPALEEGWLAVINLARDFDVNLTDHFADEGSDIALISSGCMEAARWCIAADGTTRFAVANDTDGYATGTGTSYAAPQVSAAIALLAQAFPTLSASELRNRLLVTADNGFFTTGDPLVQTMTFADGVTHDYHWDYGHGFVDLRAALLPIGALSTKSANGSQVSLETPLVVSGAGVGSAPQAALSDVTLAASDQLGGVFGAEAAQFAASGAGDLSHLTGLNALAGRNLGSERKLGRAIDTNAAFDQGRTLSLQLAEGFHLDTRLPANDMDAAGARLTFATAYLGGDLSMGISHIQAASDPIGLSHVAGQMVGSEASSLQLDWQRDLSAHTSFNLSALAGMSRPEAGNAIARFSDMHYSDLGIGISHRGLFGKADRLSLTLRQPLAATTGSAQMQLETLDSNNKAILSDININLAPEARESEIGVEYQTSGPFGTEWQFSATHTENAGHSAGQSAVNIDAAVQLRF